MKARPTGITIIGTIFIILGTISFLWSMLVFGIGGIGSVVSSLFTLSPQISGNLWGGLLGMVTAVVQFATGIGLLRLSGWSWYLAFIGVALSVIQGLFGMFSGGIMTFICAGLGLIIPAGVAFYLLQPQIRALFGVGTTPS